MSDIKYAYPLILNKVASPQYVTPTLRRARLIDWLNAASNCRAVVIAADAGYGKTTLLWQWEREVDFPCYWYKLDRSDRDWTFHISYLTEAVAKRHPGFGTRAHSMLQQLGGPGSSRPGVAAYLLAEMHERLTEPCTFIIDDWHYVNAVTEVRGLWNQILRDAPPTCRFIFSSRAKPKLQFARFKTHNAYAELGTDSLRFTTDETAELFREIYRNPLDASELDELDRHTEGWAASLQLIDVSLRQHGETDERREFIKSVGEQSSSDLFGFLAEEVLDQQPEETKNFLLTTAILHQITAEVAERLAGVHDGRRLLAELEQSGLFTHRLDEHRYRYHHLFREFLKRRLTEERPQSEVVALHIHAASYFETSQQWPEAIHHYLRAGLQRQAARLVAKYGEHIVATGRLELVDKWLEELPRDVIRQNARLGLLYGETRGMRGDWELAQSALLRARSFFARKGDRRLEALACLKLSSVLSSFGDAEGAADCAQAGLDIGPADDASTRLRLEGNLAVTRTWLTGPLDAVVRECERIAREARSRGLEHYAAIADHNAGLAMVRLGRIADGTRLLERAAEFWDGPPTSPFPDNSDLVVALLTQGDVRRASRIADEAGRRTRPWPRPRANANYGRAAVRAYEGRFGEAARILAETRADPAVLGGLDAHLVASLVEYLYLGDADPQAIAAAGDELVRARNDQREQVELAPAIAISAHARGRCKGRCISQVGPLVAAAGEQRLASTVARVKLGALALAHGGPRLRAAAWAAARDASDLGILGLMRWWLRRYAPYASTAPAHPNGIKLILEFSEADPDGWRTALNELLVRTTGPARAEVLAAITRHPDQSTVEALSVVPGTDVTTARRRLRAAQAVRLFVRTFGGISIRRGNWDGAEIPLDKRRVRGLVGVLAAHSMFTLSRDAAVEILWPEADANSGINNLNQTVFQLRRYIDPTYRTGESPEYVVSTSEEVRLNPTLVRTDLSELLKVRERLATSDSLHRKDVVERAIGLLRGEFLEDLRYEDWTTRFQLTVHTELRDVLLPRADGRDPEVHHELRAKIAAALLRLDAYDESAVVALTRALALSGRASAARKLITEYAQRTRSELGEEPSASVTAAAELVGAAFKPVKPSLT